MSTPRPVSTPSRAAGRWRVLVWGVLALGAASVLFVLGVVLGRTPPQPPPAAATSPPAAAFSATPVSADALAAIDLDALLAQDDLLPTGYAVLGQPSKRVPDTLRAVPTPAHVRTATLTLLGVNAGNITMLLYPSVEERDAAEAEMMRRVFAFGTEVDRDEISSSYPLPRPEIVDGVGERATLQRGGDMTFTETSSTDIAVVKVVFVRCGAAVQVRITAPAADGLAEAATEIAQALDQLLAPRVCQAPGIVPLPYGLFAHR